MLSGYWTSGRRAGLALALYWTTGGGQIPSYLSRADGLCQFCENSHWRFPQGCPYGKPKEKQYAMGFLEKVAREVISSGTG